ncbi:MAG TPA: hypothetical protein DCL49_14780, partial [Candidatus Omnitrophica bacterium]|nr:hypothetical protein [Candidatus Omnitrophota bacterium]
MLHMDAVLKIVEDISEISCEPIKGGLSRLVYVISIKLKNAGELNFIIKLEKIFGTLEPEFSAMKTIKQFMVDSLIDQKKVKVVPAIGILQRMELGEGHEAYIMSEEYINHGGQVFDELVKSPSRLFKRLWIGGREYTELDKKYAQEVMAAIYLAYRFHNYQTVEDYNTGNFVSTADKEQFVLIDIRKNPESVSMEALIKIMWDPYVAIILDEKGEANLDTFKSIIKEALAGSKIENETEGLIQRFEEALKKVITQKRAVTSSPLTFGAVAKRADLLMMAGMLRDGQKHTNGGNKRKN